MFHEFLREKNDTRSRFPCREKNSIKIDPTTYRAKMLVSALQSQKGCDWGSAFDSNYPFFSTTIIDTCPKFIHWQDPASDKPDETKIHSDITRDAD